MTPEGARVASSMQRRIRNYRVVAAIDGAATVFALGGWAATRDRYLLTMAGVTVVLGACNLGLAAWVRDAQRDLEASEAHYEQVLAALGAQRIQVEAELIAWGYEVSEGEDGRPTVHPQPPG